MSAKREYLWGVFKTIPQSPDLVYAALTFFHAEVPVELARDYVAILATKVNERNPEHANDEAGN
jgi:hypothetical protein